MDVLVILVSQLVSFVICSTLSGINCGPFWYFRSLSGVNCGQFLHLALFQVLIAENCGILSPFLKALIADKLCGKNI